MVVVVDHHSLEGGNIEKICEYCEKNQEKLSSKARGRHRLKRLGFREPR
jgi:hypothetical protein